MKPVRIKKTDRCRGCARIDRPVRSQPCVQCTRTTRGKWANRDYWQRADRIGGLIK